MGQGTASENGGGRAGKYLSFALGPEEYAIRVLQVREIVKLQHITSVPDTPPDVRGVINLRGKVIPVIDLRVKFGMSDAEDGQRTCIVVVEVAASQNGPMGIIVDEVSEVLTLAETDIQDTPDFGSGVETPFLLGLAKVKDSVKILLDIDQVLISSDLASFNAAVSASEALTN
ncbi:MAG: purine-binding chemotaxis protein CheW [Bryobacteraceae bacterium]|nr:purine-binding chemotaxis protein CheW [Bryobacteraceae bacterium]